MEGQYNESVKAQERTEEELARTKATLARREAENVSLREELTTMTVTEQHSRIEFLECMKSLQVSQVFLPPPSNTRSPLSHATPPPTLADSVCVCVCVCVGFNCAFACRS